MKLPKKQVKRVNDVSLQESLFFFINFTSNVNFADEETAYFFAASKSDTETFCRSLLPETNDREMIIFIYDTCITSNWNTWQNVKVDLEETSTVGVKGWRERLAWKGKMKRPWITVLFIKNKWSRNQMHALDNHT